MNIGNNGYATMSVDELRKVAWIDKYLDGHKGFIAGGCFKHILCDEKVSDIDIFFRSSDDLNEALRNVFYDEKLYKATRDTAKVVSYEELSTGMKIDLVKSIYGEPYEVLDRFDFTITKMAYYREEVPVDAVEESIDINPFNPTPSVASETKTENTIMYTPDFFFHLSTKRLVLDKDIPFPVSTFERMLRYTKYGYYPCRETKAKLIEAIQESEIPESVSQSLYNGMD